MTELSRSNQRVTEFLSRVFGRLTTAIVGFALIALGVGMMVTIVMLPVGVVLLLLGVLIVVFGLLVPGERTGRPDGE